MHKINQILLAIRETGRLKECEKLLITERSKPLPLPTLKLSEPPGAVRPDGNLNTPPPDRLTGQSPVN
jgi:hypothetical protein